MAKRFSLQTSPPIGTLDHGLSGFVLQIVLQKSPAQRSPRKNRPRMWRSSGMGENILGGKAGKIEPHPVRQEAETGGGEAVAALARQHDV